MSICSRSSRNIGDAKVAKYVMGDDPLVLSEGRG